MKNFLRLISLCFFVSLSQLVISQINIKVSVKSIAVTANVDCDGFLDGDSDFLFEYKAIDNSPSANGNNNPTTGSIGACNFAVVNGNNGSYTLTPSAPGSAIFSPTTGLFFDRTYNCKQDVPSELTITWRAYENDDAAAPSVTPMANGVVPAQANSYTVSTSNGTYTTQYTQTSSDGGCPQTYVIEFEIQKTQGSFLPLSIGSASGNTICTGATNGEIESSITGGSGTVLFDWSHDGLSDYDDNLELAGVSVGNYTLVVKDALNCTDTISANVFETDAPINISSFTDASSVVCAGQNSIAYAVPSQSNTVFVWGYNAAGTMMNGSGNAITIDFNNTATSGTLTVFAQNSCSVSPTLTMAITVNPIPNILINGNNLICENASQTLIASGASSYTWSSGEQTASITVSSSVTTIYTVTATNTFGCISSKQFTVDVLPTPTLQVNGSTLAVCPNETVAVSATGSGNLFIWSDGFIGTNHNVKAAATTIFTITNTDANSCYSQTTFTLNVHPGPALAISGNTLVCSKVLVNLTASGADSYEWSGGIATNTVSFIPLVPTTITVVGTTTDGCRDSIVQPINVLNTPTVSIDGESSICEGESVTLTANSTGTVTYGWNTGANTSSITVTPIGTFTYIVTVDNGACIAVASQEVEVRLIPTIDFTIATPLLCTIDPIITFTADPSGGTFYGTGVTGDTFDPSIGAGTYPISYSLTVSNGCVASQTQTLNVMVCSGVNELTLQSNAILYPNPATSNVMLQSDKVVSSVLIYDYSGKLVKIIEMNALESNIEVSDLAKGFYTFTLNMNDRSQTVIKMVKE